MFLFAALLILFPGQLLDCYGRQFCLHFEAFHLKKTPMYIAFMQFMGDEEEATSFSYTLEVNGNGRKMTWQGVPRSIRDSHKTVRDSQDGLIITRKLALFFSADNTNSKQLKLKISGRVWREHWRKQYLFLFVNPCNNILYLQQNNLLVQKINSSFKGKCQVK